MDLRPEVARGVPTGRRGPEAVPPAPPPSPGGLTGAEAAARLAEVGPNEIVERRAGPVRRFLGFLWGPIPWMIEAAAILSAVVRHWSDFAIIGVLLLANAVVGFWEEWQAEGAIAALRAHLAPVARVRRDGRWQTVAARGLVPGDRVRLRLGDVVPADATLLEGEGLEVDQSALTGESLPVTRGPGDTVYSGAIVRRGELDATVTATGARTYFGRTAELVAGARTVSHFQRAVLRIGDFLIVLAVALVALIVTVALLRGDALGETLQFALVLTVASIPVAMPTVLSVTMAVGARVLAAKQAVVTRLAAVEELAGIDLLYSDKTGTLTQNRLTLGEVVCAEGVTAAEVRAAAALASRAEDGDPIDLAVLEGAEVPEGAGTVTAFRPFDPVGKRTEATVRRPDGARFRVTKGAPQVILALTDPPAPERRWAEGQVEALARRGDRALGVARADGDGPFRLLGILPLFDPPRDDSAATVTAARRLGVRVKMVTGDQLAIAREIAGRLDLGTRILEAKDLAGADLDAADGFAEVFPEHKYHLVQLAQGGGHIVGMTGDGVNDAPALKQADAGIAVAGATDAARAAASIVLLTPGLSVIVDAIREARRIFQRITSYALYRITETVRVLLFMTLSILVFDFYPVTAVMLVLLALLNDGAILAIAFDRARPSDRLEAWDTRAVLGISTVLGVFGVVASFGLFFLAERVFHLDRGTVQTLMYLKLSVAGHLTIFITRTRGRLWTRRPSWILVGAVLGTQAVATLVAVYGLFMAPLGWAWAGIVWAYAAAFCLVNDQVKLLAYRLFDPHHRVLGTGQGAGD